MGVGVVSWNSRSCFLEIANGLFRVRYKNQFGTERYRFCTETGARLVLGIRASANIQTSSIDRKKALEANITGACPLEIPVLRFGIVRKRDHSSSVTRNTCVTSLFGLHITLLIQLSAPPAIRLRIQPASMLHARNHRKAETSQS